MNDKNKLEVVAQFPNSELAKVGLTPEQCEQLNKILESCSKTPDLAWEAFTKSNLADKLDFTKHLKLYRRLSESPLPVWIPNSELTNATSMVKDWGCKDLDDLFSKAKLEPETTWDYFIKKKNIKLHKQASRTMVLDKQKRTRSWLKSASLNIVESCFQADPQKNAIICGNEKGVLVKLTYQEVQQRCQFIAHGLKRLGFKPGDCIAIDMSMNADAVCVYLGIIWAGLTVVSIADSFSSDEIATRLRISNAKAIFTQSHLTRAGKVLPLYEKVVQANAPQAIVLGNPETLRSEDITWESFIKDCKAEEITYVDPMHHSNILFSSGTTGEPKAIPWNHTTPIKSGSDAWFHHNIQEVDILAWPTNLGWMMGPWLIYASLMNGATMALYEGLPSGEGFGKFIEKTDVTMLGVIPSLVKTWRDTQCMEACDWSKIKRFSSTGECSNAEDMLYLMYLAGYKPVIEYCGGTEIGGAYLTSTMNDPNIPSHFSRVAIGLDMVLVNDENQESNTGEVFLCSPSMGLSTEILNRDHDEAYYENTPNIKRNFPLRRHGDQIEKLENGFYRAGGRVDDTMNLGGIKTSSAELEAVISGMAQVSEVAAISVPPKGGGPEQLVIYISPELPEANLELIKKQMQASIRKKLNPLFKILEIVSINKLPRTASNKVMRRVLRDSYQKSN